MRKRGVVLKWGALALVAAALTLSVSPLVHSQANAVRPEPDCGPTREWVCVVPGCPNCPVVLFEGTVCEKAQFEKQTGRVCSPP